MLALALLQLQPAITCNQFSRMLITPATATARLTGYLLHLYAAVLCKNKKKSIFVYYSFLISQLTN